MSEPMSDERLAFLRKVSEQSPGARGDLSAAEERELLDEVANLRRWKAESSIEYVSPKIASHLRSLARDVAYTEGHASVMRAAAGRIESLEAERDKQTANAKRWMKAEWDQHERADRAEARLARVTDDRMAERIARRFMLDWECEVRRDSDGPGWHCNLHTTEAPDGVCKSAMFDAESALATIRAVAADEQEAGQ